MHPQTWFLGLHFDMTLGKQQYELQFPHLLRELAEMVQLTICLFNKSTAR
jgi:hypothetical protein